MASLPNIKIEKTQKQFFSPPHTMTAAAFVILPHRRRCCH
jgi:hypothetical protein